MFAVIYIESEKRNFVVPTKWIKFFNCEEYIKEGVNLLENNIVFFSTKNEDADFTLPIDQLQVNGENNRGCFHGKILKFCSK